MNEYGVCVCVGCLRLLVPCEVVKCKQRLVDRVERNVERRLGHVWDNTYHPQLAINHHTFSQHMTTYIYTAGVVIG